MIQYNLGALTVMLLPNSYVVSNVIYLSLEALTDLVSAVIRSLDRPCIWGDLPVNRSLDGPCIWGNLPVLGSRKYLRWLTWLAFRAVSEVTHLTCIPCCICTWSIWGDSPDLHSLLYLYRKYLRWLTWLAFLAVSVQEVSEAPETRLRLVPAQSTCWGSYTSSEKK